MKLELEDRGCNVNVRALNQKGWFSYNGLFPWKENNISVYEEGYNYGLGYWLVKQTFDIGIQYHFILYEDVPKFPTNVKEHFRFLTHFLLPSLSPNYILHSPGVEINFDGVRIHINGYFSQQTTKTAKEMTPKAECIRFLEQSRVGWDAQFGFNIKGFFPFFQFNQYWLEGSNFTATTSYLTPSKETKKINGWVVGMNYQLPWYKHMSIGVQRVHDNIYQGRWKINWQFNLAHEDNLPLYTPLSLVRQVKWLPLSNDTVPAVICL